MSDTKMTVDALLKGFEAVGLSVQFFPLQLGAANRKPFTEGSIALHKIVDAVNAAQLAAPVAQQEPIGYVTASCDTDSIINHSLPVGMGVYAAPVAAPAEQVYESGCYTPRPPAEQGERKPDMWVPVHEVRPPFDTDLLLTISTGKVVIGMWHGEFGLDWADTGDVADEEAHATHWRLFPAAAEKDA